MARGNQPIVNRGRSVVIKTYLGTEILFDSTANVFWFSIDAFDNQKFTSEKIEAIEAKIRKLGVAIEVMAVAPARDEYTRHSVTNPVKIPRIYRITGYDGASWLGENGKAEYMNRADVCRVDDGLIERCKVLAEQFEAEIHRVIYQHSEKYRAEVVDLKPLGMGEVKQLLALAKAERDQAASDGEE